MKNTSYNIANESIIWEKIGKQIVIADLTTGKYCCIENESGVLAWECLMSGHTQENLLLTLAGIYKNFDAKCHQQILLFIEKLTELGVLASNTDNHSKNADNIHNALAENNQFEEPRLLIYSDLDTLLMIDPIDDDLELAAKSEDLILQ